MSKKEQAGGRIRSRTTREETATMKTKPTVPTPTGKTDSAILHGGEYNGHRVWFNEVSVPDSWFGVPARSWVYDRVDGLTGNEEVIFHHAYDNGPDDRENARLYIGNVRYEAVGKVFQHIPTNPPGTLNICRNRIFTEGIEQERAEA